MDDLAADQPAVAMPVGSPVPGYFADPALVAFDGRYYVYPTTDGSDQWAATAFRAFSSADLLDWHDHGVVLELGRDVAWAQRHAWAPAAASRAGRYYLYFTARTDSIGVAVADSPLGPFRDLGRPLIEAGRFEGRAIDPSVFTDDDGTAYLYWGNGTAHGVPLNEDMTSFDASRVVSWTPTDFREAAHVHRRGDVYYLSWSVDDTRDENYRVLYATGPGPLGPWTDRGVLLEKAADRGILATGHHSVLNIPGTDEWVIAYHRFAIPGGDGFHRELAFDLLHHQADGSITRVVPASAPLCIPLQDG
ncbi:family 43 glycosylhydrolase [Streptomyces galilaeus]